MTALPTKLLPEGVTFCPSGYCLHLYCDHDNPAHAFMEFPHEFDAEVKATARREAQKKGWKLRSDNTATCPKCCKALGIGKFRKHAR